VQPAANRLTEVIDEPDPSRVNMALDAANAMPPVFPEYRDGSHSLNDGYVPDSEE
jgi:hypothetical protein